MDSKQVGRPKYNFHLMQELFEKEKKFIKIVTTFTPNLKVSSVTSKFYAYHDIIDDEPDQDFINMIMKKAGSGPKDKWSKPCLESHEYGWYIEPLIEENRGDIRLHHPRVAEISKINVNLQKGSKTDTSLKPFKH